MVLMRYSFHLMLKLVYPDIKACNQFFLSIKLSFFLLQITYNVIFSFDFDFKFLNLSVLFKCYCVYDIIFMLLKNIFYLRKVCLYNISHSAKVFKQCGNLFLQFCTKDTCNFRLHGSDYTLYLFLVSGILSNQSALEFHYCFYY